MTKKTLALIIVLLASICVCACSSFDDVGETVNEKVTDAVGDAIDKVDEMNGKADEPADLTISAAASLTGLMSELATMFEKENPQITLDFNFGGSGDLATQIENGALCDVFISAAQKQMNELEDAGLIIPETRMNYLTNKLVLIVPKDGTVTSIDDLSESTVEQIAIGEPSSVPAGMYAKQALETLGLWPTVSEKAVYGKDISQVLTYVEDGEVQAGIVYETDAKNNDKIKVVADFPTESYSPITYPMATIASSAYPDQSLKFEEFLLTDEAMAVAEKYGFSSAAFVAPTEPPQP